MNNDPFTTEQRNYLEGFVTGSGMARAAVSLPTSAVSLPTSAISLPTFAQTPGVTVPIGRPREVGGPEPEDIHRAAQDRVLAAGGRLTAEETAKRKLHGLDIWDELLHHARDDRFPKGSDVFMLKFLGMFYVAPAQDSFMCRLRIPGGILSAHQLRGIADLARDFGGGFADVTTRANLQIRQIRARNAPDVLMGLHDLGIVNRGAGADNIRNITAGPTAGIDPQELIDTRPLARRMHHYILNHREMYGLPRKFNIAFDGGGSISALEETNDIGFSAVRVPEGRSVPAGVYFRMALGGITGHLDFARDTGLLLKPEECVEIAAAVVRVFIEHGDRTDRKKARLKYLLDRWGLEKFLAEVEKKLPARLCRLPLDQCEPRPAIARHGHVGVHPQKQPGLNYIGVVAPVGRLTVERMHGLAKIAERYGSSTIRLTVWQNLLISDIPTAEVPAACEAITALGLSHSATGVRAGLVACTGNAGCKYAAADTKRHALQIADYLESRLEPDHPINIHLTGCAHSCAQHFIGDIGMLATKVAEGDDLLEGYHVYVGGGYAADRAIGRELYRDVVAEKLPMRIESMLRGYREHRADDSESFDRFVRRHSIEELRTMFESREVNA